MMRMNEYLLGLYVTIWRCRKVITKDVLYGESTIKKAHVAPSLLFVANIYSQIDNIDLSKIECCCVFFTVIIDNRQ
jgi:hypothetical protein